jgi:hypothetical protein
VLLEDHCAAVGQHGEERVLTVSSRLWVDT